MTEHGVLPQSFYARRPDAVALELLGKMLVRVLGGVTMRGVITETEAYFGPEDPASRARHRRGRLTEAMKGPAGYTLVYGIHRQWLLNVVAHAEGEAGAVLIRSIKTEFGEVRGPGRVTRYMMIDKSMHQQPVFSPSSPLQVQTYKVLPDDCVERKKRIGVSRDLDTPLNFSVKKDCKAML
ncbi:DNA-3-methyladenine glycosylase [Infirmifilum sp. NZ]|uniref:DNA-3-methyladenine glycosylase n=1 Tax=Infirmifilum sp. NZ TaxID=2926850 RepID=UPI0027A232C4|nr:DNA-3-methyladenine glycosylase [Infirmifilum sp. NZ]UNQ73903.1 DNA-3-methyladenine glycosylase [Infirmifilum sp. NZ]